MTQKLRLSFFSGIACLSLSAALASPANAAVFINEIHYDNAGGDINEGVELFGDAGTSVDGWQLLFYNGGNGGVYLSETLSGTFSDELNGFGTLGFTISGLQNGPSDGVALVNSDNELLEFLSYEGAVAALSGLASGQTSIDIGVSESSATPAGMSIQRIGSGNAASDFIWASQSQSFGAFNANQVVLPVTSEVPLPASAPLFAVALASLWVRKRQLC